MSMSARRILTTVFVLAVGCALGATFALADRDDTAVIDLTLCDELLEVVGRFEEADGRVYVTFLHGDEPKRVEVRGWDPRSKKAILGSASKVLITGVNYNGKKVEYRGHVTVLK